MFKNIFITKRRRQCEEIRKHETLVRLIHKMLDLGHTDKEVADLLCVPESTVRVVRKNIEEK